MALHPGKNERSAQETRRSDPGERRWQSRWERGESRACPFSCARRGWRCPRSRTCCPGSPTGWLGSSAPPPGPGRMLGSGHSAGTAGSRTGCAAPAPAPGAAAAAPESRRERLRAHGTGCAATASGRPERSCHCPPGAAAVPTAPALPPQVGAAGASAGPIAVRSPSGRSPGPATAGAGTARPCAG